RERDMMQMEFASKPELRAEVLRACRVLTHFRIVEGFGHVSVRVPGHDRILMTPRIALATVREADLIELDLEGRQLAGGGRPALETAMHLAVYRSRPDVRSIARGHPRHVAAYAAAAEPLRVAHGFGANLGWIVPVFEKPVLAASPDLGMGVAQALGEHVGVILQANGMLATGASVAHACVNAIFMEETAELQLAAQAAGLAPKFYTPEGAARRHGDDREHEPVRAWDYYVAMAERRCAWDAGA
ncbi:MAG TPA: class II aldolase/adducin family protein, partial [Beijerinckiaceae bacterium]